MRDSHGPVTQVQQERTLNAILDLLMHHHAHDHAHHSQPEAGDHEPDRKPPAASATVPGASPPVAVQEARGLCREGVRQERPARRWPLPASLGGGGGGGGGGGEGEKVKLRSTPERTGFSMLASHSSAPTSARPRTMYSSRSALQHSDPQRKGPSNLSPHAAAPPPPRLAEQSRGIELPTARPPTAVFLNGGGRKGGGVGRRGEEEKGNPLLAALSPPSSMTAPPHGFGSPSPLRR